MKWLIVLIEFIALFLLFCVAINFSEIVWAIKRIS